MGNTSDQWKRNEWEINNNVYHSFQQDLSNESQVVLGWLSGIHLTVLKSSQIYSLNSTTMDYIPQKLLAWPMGAALWLQLAYPYRRLRIKHFWTVEDLRSSRAKQCPTFHKPFMITQWRLKPFWSKDKKWSYSSRCLCLCDWLVPVQDKVLSLMSTGTTLQAFSKCGTSAGLNVLQVCNARLSSFNTVQTFHDLVSYSRTTWRYLGKLYSRQNMFESD